MGQLEHFTINNLVHNFCYLGFCNYGIFVKIAISKTNENYSIKATFLISKFDSMNHFVIWNLKGLVIFGFYYWLLMEIDLQSVFQYSCRLLPLVYWEFTLHLKDVADWLWDHHQVPSSLSHYSQHLIPYKLLLSIHLKFSSEGL